MSHHQDLDIAVWAEQEEVLEALLHKLRSSAAVLTEASHAEQADLC